jgi:hypothetical protein
MTVLCLLTVRLCEVIVPCVCLFTSRASDWRDPFWEILCTNWYFDGADFVTGDAGDAFKFYHCFRRAQSCWS